MNEFPINYFEHNGFKQIDETIISAGQMAAEHRYNSASFKTKTSNCVIVYKKDNDLCVHLKRDYNTAIREATKLMEEGINSIIYIFTNYPKIVKHHVISDVPLPIPDYEGKGKTFLRDVRGIDTSEPFNPANN